MRFTLGSLAVIAALAAFTASSATATWTVPPTSVLPNTSLLTGVHCVTISTCLLVGRQSGASSSALAGTWDGTSFAQQTPVSTTAELFGATCGPTICFAVGHAYSSGTFVPHAESWNGSSFGSSTTATPSGATYSDLYRVACPSSTLCFAAGYYNNGTDDLPLMEVWNGTSWSIQSLSLPVDTHAGKLAGITCTSASSCWSVGFIETDGQPRKALAISWDGSSWTTGSAAIPAGAVGSALSGVACPSASNCQAVGIYNDSSSVQRPLAESWNGTSWSLQSFPTPGGGATDPQLFDLSCSGTSACETVGWTTVSGTTQPLVAGWNGSTWALQSVPRPHGTSDALLAGISCPSTCLSVGYTVYDGSTGITGIRTYGAFGP
ncbi:hypothetical protein [Baekduia sp. Peel2402]|uniref:hypothetical protein n=1 Tax=Baekduia sp. Peel2402 TaxID=3458296 RepID=UPI00403EF673